jgi:hypothetical protein
MVKKDPLLEVAWTNAVSVFTSAVNSVVSVLVLLIEI